MTEHILKRHNKTLILYHLVCPVRYRQKALKFGVTETIIRNYVKNQGQNYEQLLRTQLTLFDS